MKTFIKKLSLFLCLTILSGLLFTAFSYFIIGNSFQKGYPAAIIDKIDRLMTIKGAKIILIGDSNLSFGMNSALIEKEFNLPTVNLGLHGGLGNDFHEGMAKFNIGSGDIVVICHDNYSDEGLILNPEIAWATVEYHKELWPLISKANYLKMLKAYPKYALTGIIYSLTGGEDISDTTPYRRNAFNQYGDVQERPSRERFVFSKGSVGVPGISQTCVNRLNELNRYVKSKGATLLVAGYPIASGEFTPSKSEFQTFQKELDQALDCEIISDFTDYFIPYQYFYDTVFHLTEEGAQIRTRQLIEDLHKWGLSSKD